MAQHHSPDTITEQHTYPFWLRFWHWSNALVFLALIVSGLALDRGGDVLFLSEVHLVIHNIAGLLLAALWALFLSASLISGNWRHYLPRPKGLAGRLAGQANAYLRSIVRLRRHPHLPNPGSRFNPLEQVAYLGVIGALAPIVIITGLLLYFGADEGGASTLSLHASVGDVLTAFMAIHVYLALTGETAGRDLERMIVGSPTLPSSLEEEGGGKETEAS